MNRLSIVNEVVALYDGADIQATAARANVCVGTLYMWRRGDVRNPKAETLAKVAGVFGLQIELHAGQPKLVGAVPPARRVASSASWSWRWRIRH